MLLLKMSGQKERDTEKQKVHQKGKQDCFYCKSGCTSVLCFMKSFWNWVSSLLTLLHLPFFFFLKIFLLASMGGSDYTPNLRWNSEHFHISQRLKSLSIAWSWACCHVKSFWVQSQFAIIFSFPDRFTLNLVRQN